MVGLALRVYLNTTLVRLDFLVVYFDFEWFEEIYLSRSWSS